jgi:hypothetical protein
LLKIKITRMPIKHQLHEFDNYLSEFIKNTESKQTHLSFNKGKYNIPDIEFDNFYKKYFEFIKTKKYNENVYLIEKIYNENFSFFMDIDEDKNKNKGFVDQDISIILNCINDVINENYNENIINELKLNEHVVCKRENKYHIIYSNLIVNDIIAKK